MNKIPTFPAPSASRSAERSRRSLLPISSAPRSAERGSAELTVEAPRRSLLPLPPLLPLLIFYGYFIFAPIP